MTKQISFIHAADLHLDSPFQGLAHTPQHIFQEIQESTFTALNNLVRIAIEKQVDFILLVGDLFDNERQSLKAQIRLRNAFEKLKNYNISVYLSYGNHDHIHGNIHPVTYPDNVFVFPNEEVAQFIYKRNGKEIATIYGFSYENRSVTERKVDEYEIHDHQIPFHIATLHGSLQSNRDHDTYAPFKISDLSNKGFDYWALGHIHKKEILRHDPLIVYPGNTQGRNRTEQGEKGCYYVKLSEIESDISFIPLQAIMFASLNIDISNCEEIHQVEAKVQQALHMNEAPTLIDLDLYSDHEHHLKWEVGDYLEEIIDIVNEANIHKTNWTYIFRYSFNIDHRNVEPFNKGDHFIGELASSFENTSIQPILKELYSHRQGRKYLSSISESEEEMIKLKARQLLERKILKNRG